MISLIMMASCDEQQSRKKVSADPAIEGVPEWAKGVVWYQIFPERFRNGDTGNDPVLADQEGCWPHELREPWEVHPWNSDWYAMQDYEKANGEDIWYNITRRRYGGDLQGIIDKLDYLQELGVEAIYLNPVFMAPSHHKYDISTYHHIDPNFGPDPAGDRKIIESEVPDDPATWQWTSADKLALKLIEEVHHRGMRIIFDGVFNHVGFNHFAIVDVRKKQQGSRFADWFTIHSWNNAEAGTEFDYQGWWGIRDMPELREDEQGIVDGPRQYIFNITKRWMDPFDDGELLKGIDGWRLDVAYEVGHPFWKDWRKHVRSINPDAYLVAEVIDTPEKLKPYLSGDEFDAVMNYNFDFICSEFFINNGITTGEFDERLKVLREAYRYDNSLAMQNLLGSHDTDRPSSRIKNKGIASFLEWEDYFGIGKARNPKYLTDKPSDEDYQLLKMMAAFQMTYPGAPMVYYGDEAGMWGAGDPDCRKPMLWEDIEYENERIDACGKPYKVQHEVNPDL
ncbi:MAG: glycoside hydrolase family 13 protein, partial [Bacteroidales bacterium]|nr:glycoside hydrolase family 13 protein [Bacteroidales bacterium]